MGASEDDLNRWLDLSKPMPNDRLPKKVFLKMLGFTEQQRSRAPITPSLIEKYLKQIAEEERVKKQIAIDDVTPDKPI